MKKLFSVVLAMAMIVSLASVALADRDPEWGSLAHTGVEFNEFPTSAKYEFAKTRYEDPPTVKFDDDEYFYPIVGLIGPYTFNSEDRAIYNSDDSILNASDGKDNILDGPIEYGDAAYYALIQYIPENPATESRESDYSVEGISTGAFSLVMDSQTVSNLKIKADWEEGGDYVDNISIVKRKIDNKMATNLLASEEDIDDNDQFYPSAVQLGLDEFGYEEGEYYYFLVIEYEESTSHNDADVIGNLEISKSKEPKVDMEVEIEVNLDWEFNYRDATTKTNTQGQQYVDYEWELDGDPEYILESDRNYALKFDYDDVITIEFEDDCYFEVDVSGQSKMLFNYNTEYVTKVAARYPYAELNFWNGNGAKFNRVGEMFINCEDLTGTQFLYQVNSDGSVSKVAGAEYDDSDEGFYFNTRTLGSYVISDTELIDDEEEVDVEIDAPTTTVRPTNPATGVEE